MGRGVRCWGGRKDFKEVTLRPESCEAAELKESNAPGRGKSSCEGWGWGAGVELQAGSHWGWRGEVRLGCRAGLGHAGLGVATRA